MKVVAARVSGVECPNNKRVEFSIQYIYGIGPTTAQAIMAETVGPLTPCWQLFQQGLQCLCEAYMKTVCFAGLGA